MGGLFKALRSLLRQKTPPVAEPTAVHHTELPPSAPPLHDVTGLPRGDETILMVDYDPTVREPIARFLRESGYTVLEAGDGQEALEVIAGRAQPAIDFLLCDMVLPRVDGKQLAYALRNDCPKHRILFYANYPTELAIRNEMLDPAIAYVQKPIVPQRLAITLRQMLDQAKAIEQRNG